MPKIGLRNIKTAIAVAISLSIYLIIILVCEIIYHDLSKSIKMASQIYTPFFACIATAYSIGTDKSKSLAQAKLRIIASIIGGLFGIAVLAIYIYGFHLIWPFSYISATGNPTNGFNTSDFSWNFILSFVPAILLVMFSSVIVVWMCNIFKQKSSSFIAVLTLTAVMSSLGTAPIIYGFNRILSTIIGVLIALGVNMFSIPKYKNKDKLFIVSMDGIYMDNEEAINGFHSYKVNQLINNGANVTYFSTRTPMGLIPLTNDVKLKEPVVCLSGAALYDINKKEFLYVEKLDQVVAKKVLEIIKNNNISPFVNTIKDNVLYIFNDNPTNEAELIYANERKNGANGCYMSTKIPSGLDICYFVAVETVSKIEELKKVLNQSSIINDIVYYEYDCYSITELKAIEGYKYFKIYSSKIKELNCLNYFKDKGYKLVGCGTHLYDTNLFTHCEYSFTDIDSCIELKSKASNVLTTTNNDLIFKEIDRLYHKKDKRENS